MSRRFSSHEAWPAPYSGVPGALFALSMILIIVAFLLNITRSTLSAYTLCLFLASIVFALLSVGKEVLAVKGRLVLVYGYPVSIFKYSVTNITEISALDNLSRGKIFKYFKLYLVPSTMMMHLPVIYVILTAPSIPIEYLTFLLAPVVAGLILTVRCMLTYFDFMKFIKYTGSILGAISTILCFQVASIYNKVFGRPITSDLRTLAFLMTGMLLTFVFYAMVLYFSTRRHLIVIEDSAGRHYAIVAVDEKTAQELVNIVV